MTARIMRKASKPSRKSASPSSQDSDGHYTRGGVKMLRFHRRIIRKLRAMIVHRYWSPEAAVAAQLRTVRKRTMKTISLKDAVALIPDAASLMIGGFMAVGTPERVV